MHNESDKLLIESGLRLKEPEKILIESEKIHNESKSMFNK
jgi:hypothetical protein